MTFQDEGLKAVAQELLGSSYKGPWKREDEAYPGAMAVGVKRKELILKLFQDFVN